MPQEADGVSSPLPSCLVPALSNQLCRHSNPGLTQGPFKAMGEGYSPTAEAPLLASEESSGERE